MKKIAFLTSFNADLVKRECAKYCQQNYDGLFDFWWHNYGQSSQSVFDSSSALYSFNPDILFFHFEIETIIGDKFYDPFSLPDEDWKLLIANAKAGIKNLIDTTLNNLPKCKIIYENFISRDNSINCNLDPALPFGTNRIVDLLNDYLFEISNQYTGQVYLNNYAELVTEYGRQNWYDSRMLRLAKQPFNYKYFCNLAKHYFDAVLILTVPRKKCIVVDLDNTLWGGIIGQDGIENIKIGGAGIGEAFVYFQKTLLNLYRQGIFLAVCSKNNFEDAIEAIEKHPDMVLRKEYFSCIKINWLDKAHNIKEIASELNIGLDSLVFIDDNPAECELVQHQLPQVEVINLTGDPDNYIRQILTLTSLKTFSLTSEDLNRNVMHKQDVLRKELETSFSNLDDYYKSLNMKGYLYVNNANQIGRIAQMTQKTNQFNITTRRYSNEEINEFMSSGLCRIYSLRLEDKFGDNGIIAAAVVQCSNINWHLDSFIMSCRVIGRQVENLLMQAIFDDALNHNISTFSAEFIKTKKNAPCENLLPDSGFSLEPSGRYNIKLPAANLNHKIELIREY